MLDNFDFLMNDMLRKNRSRYINYEAWNYGVCQKVLISRNIQGVFLKKIACMTQ